MFYFSYVFLVKRNRQEMYRRYCEQWGQTGIPFKLRLGLFVFGLRHLYSFGYELAVRSFVEGGYWYRGHLTGWLNPAMFSSSILSTTLLLFMSLLTGLTFMVGPLSFYLAIRGFNPPHH